MTELESRRYQELEKVCKSGGGVLSPASVVKFAKNPKTALHDVFEWDDTKAAHAHRVWQARAFIVTVEITGVDDKPQQVYVSLSTDRVVGGGYRTMRDVAANKELRRQAIEDAIKELRRVEEKHRQLTELSPVFKAVDRVEQQQQTTV